jgi:hypothetical protein
VAYIHNKVKSISWDWDRIGGCGACSLKLKESFDGAIAGSLIEDYSLRAYVEGTLWYSGYIDRVSPSMTGNDETIDVLALGYVNQLKRIIVREKTYQNKEISTIVRDIAEVYATAYTDIISTAANYIDTGYTADEVYFNESAFDAISKLADIAGRREWGVDASRNLFFKRRDDQPKHHFNLSQDFVSFQPIRDYNPIITKIYLEGSDEYKQIFTITNRTTLREEIVSNSAIKTSSVGYQFARMYLKEHAIPKRSYVGKQANRSTRVEETIPLGKALIATKIGVRYKYDVVSQKYDSGLKYDGGNEYLQIEKVHYELKDENLDATLYLGPLPPSLSEQLARLEYEINTERIRT